MCFSCGRERFILRKRFILQADEGDAFLRMTAALYVNNMIFQHFFVSFFVTFDYISYICTVLSIVRLMSTQEMTQQIVEYFKTQPVWESNALELL